MKYKYILFLLLLGISLSLVAQHKVRIYGYVYDENKRGLELVNVALENGRFGTSTNLQGYYDFKVEIKDSSTLLFSQVGYKTERRTIHSNQSSIELSFVLKRTSKQLSEVNVIGQKIQTSTLDMMDASKVKLLPNAAGGIESMLMTFAGVSSSNELSSQYNVRGGNFDENMVYVNGIELYRPLLVRSGQQEGLSFINPDMVRNVSFSSGGFDAQYGDKMSSVLDIQYKRPEKFESTVSASFLGATAFVGTSNDKFTQMHGFRYKTNGYLMGTLDTQGEYKPHFFDYQTNLCYQLSPKSKLSFLGNVSQNSYQFTPQTRQTTFGTTTEVINLRVFFEGQEKDLFLTAFGSLSWDFQPHKGLNLRLLSSVFNSNESVNYDILGDYVLNESIGNNSNVEKEGKLIGVGKYHQHARNLLNATVSNISHLGDYSFGQHKMKWGVTLQNERIIDNIGEWEWRDSVGYSLPTSSRLEMFYNLKSNEKLMSWRTSAFFQESYKWNMEASSVLFTGGMRANHWSFNNELLLSPRLSVALLPHWKKDFSFRFATGLYYQAPFYKEIRDTVTDGLGNVNVHLNNNIKSPRSLHFVLGGDYYFKTFGRALKFTTEVYLKLADRMISYTVDNVQVRYSGLNDAKTYTAGVDFKLYGEFLPGADSWINLSLMQSKMKLDNDLFTYYKYVDNQVVATKSHRGWYPTSSEQRFVVSVLFQDYLPNNPNYKLHLKMVLSDGLPFGPPRDLKSQNSFRTQPYKRVDIGASRVLASGGDKLLNKPFFKHVKSIWLNAEIFNLLDFTNVNSHYWVTQIDDSQMAVPNYLTNRMFNLKLIVDFK